MAATEIKKFIEENKHLITPEMAQKIINKRCEIVKEMFYIFDDEIEKLSQEIDKNVDVCLDYFIYDLLKEEIDGMRNFNYVEDYVENVDSFYDYKDIEELQAIVEQINFIIDTKRELFPGKSWIKKDIRELKKMREKIQNQIDYLECIFRG